MLQIHGKNIDAAPKPALPILRSLHNMNWVGLKYAALLHRLALLQTSRQAKAGIIGIIAASL
ncbi:hypothetical protein COCSUDRAFT_34566 [Coccomyxa subellipsoidea C-169]|uniref:Uncharacterized protein n=1 Tax=Coccomyxa subellipsoidea (strain C-169) TaxID=574566 RepID=I0YJ52_COCSC|nr:hypothetical protein COCSUDRAFT_34566 [Coccomyxa subellipsoidea C-169]EIE18421.1 hypothetical protein COCSUDRAFT_34566 [Coccomyxa subellipsoidea C-169]|eukprot:XP_005642965.1 hypothetical protein COCSUDRAFT_34566 [Coccomyxa subellipsoidea C-169]